MLLLVGLGNPGPEYTGNRHNVGAMAVDAIIDRCGLSQLRTRMRPSGTFSDGRIGPEKVTVLKPKTFMNESGRAVGEAMRYWRLEEDQVIVFHDDLDLEPGKVRVKRGGGHGGHNGLRDIDNHIGRDYLRVRIGIGHPGDKNQVEGYVLRDFAKSDQEWLVKMLDAIADAAELLVAGDDAGFMSKIACTVNPPRTHKPKPKPEDDATANGTDS
jgi:PTH1 family peptidyl-tRNA hydrolase